LRAHLPRGFSLKKRFLTCLSVALTFVSLVSIGTPAFAQQTLGSINGNVADATGAVIPGAQIKARAIATNLEVEATSKPDGSFSIADLPIGAYEVKFIKDGFETNFYPQILVQGNRTTTVNAKLKPGATSSSVTVNATPLLNETDTTTGYVLGESIIQNTPLGTGSLTQLALLSPGVNADLLGGSGSGSGLGNRAIFANGQRDSSNSFSLNGISGNNLFNGKTTSEVGGNRFVLNTGENFSNNGGEIQTSTSVYDAIGEALPSPPQETVEELHVNSAGYDASQGANSGAHIGYTTKSGTNQFHGQLYEYFQNSFWNAAPYFRNFVPDSVIPASQKVPPLRYNRFGVTFGGPVIKDKLFFFASYQGIRVSDALIGSSDVNVPPDLTDDRSAATLAAVANTDFSAPNCGTPNNPPCVNIQPGQISAVTLALLQAKTKNGKYFIPSADPNLQSLNLGYNALVQGPPSIFHADQANFNLDYNLSSKDRLAGKYYYQHDPTTNAFASQGGPSQGGLLGFPQQLDAGSHVFAINNTTTLSNNLVWDQKIGFVREKAFASTSQPFTPATFGINLFGSTRFPGITIDDNNGNFQTLSFGPVTNFANAGMFQNRFVAATDVNLVHGKHTLALGFNWDYIQLNVDNRNNQVSGLEFFNFPDFLTGTLRTGPGHSTLFNGTSNRHYRANEAGAYAQDNIKLAKDLNLNLGLRFDWDGPLSEKNGLLTNFDPSLYNYSLATDTINNIGLVVAGNNATFPTKGVSNSTLQGRQWGFAPRFGLVWSPSRLKNIVFRTSYGLFYDRGQFFTEYSPSAGFGFNGPFGVTLQAPFVVPVLSTSSDTFENPFGTTAPPPPPKNLSSVLALVPNQAALIQGATPFLFGGYNPRNKLPYSENWGLDMQWQAAADTIVTIGYAGNHGVHLTMPIPFNQPKIATAQNPVNGQTSSYGFQPGDPNDPSCTGINAGNSCPTLLSEPFNTSTGGNTDLRVPYIGFSPNSVFWTANGISNYNALQAGVTKRLTHGLQITGSYTWSHTLDEQSGLGLFYNGNDPLHPRSSYASSDFDRTHVATFSYLYQLPELVHGDKLRGKLVNGWGISGLMVFESGQPYNVYDFSGSVGSLYYSANDFITNPIVPLAPGFTPQTAVQHGTPGVSPSLNPNAFAIPQLSPGQDGVPPCGPTTTGFETFCDTVENTFSSGGRNIFRGPFQSRVDFSILKETKLSERFLLKYQADFFNLFNHTSFDAPNNNVTFNPCFNPDPCYSFPPSGQLGLVQHTLGSPRFIQMSLHLAF
jgi:hypothetical protein